MARKIKNSPIKNADERRAYSRTTTPGPDLWGNVSNRTPRRLTDEEKKVIRRNATRLRRAKNKRNSK